MKGRVFSYGDPCPCGGAWRDVTDGVTGDVINIVCEKCLRAPTRFAIDGRSFKNRKGNVGRLFRDERGELFFYFGAAHQKLQAIRSDWGNQGPERFDPTKWSRSGRESYKLFECAREWQLYLKKDGVSRGYLQHVELFFRLHLFPNLPQNGDVDIRELVPTDIEELSLTLKAKGLSQNTVKNALTVLRTLLKRYHYRKMVLDKLIPFPLRWSATPHIERRVLNEADQRILIARMPADTQLLMEVYAALGCRPGEVCALKRKDVLDDGTILIQGAINAFGEYKGTKTGKSRVHPINIELLGRLRNLPLLPEAYLFSRSGQPFNPNRLSSSFNTIAADFPGVTLYTFARHSLASRIAREAREEGYRQAGKALGNRSEVAKIHYVME